MMEEVKDSELVKTPKLVKTPELVKTPDLVVSLPNKTCSFVQCITDKFNNQDFNQKLSISSVVALEMYRVIVSSFLVLFVPQKCDDHVCSLKENMVLENHLYNAGLVFNFITMASFLAMYTFEIKRENRLITYLEVNKSVPTDNISVGNALEKLQVSKRDSIWELDKYYMYSGFTSINIFIVNTILSGFVIYKYYLDSQTTTTYITNILFMVTKLIDVYSNVNTERNIFYSAYMKGKIQYNDVDPDKVLHQLSFNMPPSGAEMNGLDQLLCASSTQKGVKDTVLNIENDNVKQVNNDYVSVPGINLPIKDDTNEDDTNEEDTKIIVTNHDISNPSSCENLQNLETQV
jgi:hypothetical protein